MKAIVEHEAYQKSIYRTYGVFPFMLLIIGMIGAYLFGLFMEFDTKGLIENFLSPELLADAFFRGVVITVLVFYMSRLGAIRASDKSVVLKELDEEGWYLTCMSHNSWKDRSLGNLIITPTRLYFQPDRQKNMELSFDHSSYEDFVVELGPEKESLGLFILTGKKHLIHVKDGSGKVLNKFVVAEADKYLDVLKEHIQR